MDFSDLMGMRAQLLSQTKTKRLVSSDRRLVTFKGHPVGVIQRRPGTMLWFSPKRRVPYTSRADAAMSIVADLFLARRDGGMPAVAALIASAQAEVAALEASALENDDAYRNAIDAELDQMNEELNETGEGMGW